MADAFAGIGEAGTLGGECAIGAVGVGEDSEVAAGVTLALVGAVVPEVHVDALATRPVAAEVAT